jgi:hypothetical protein
MCDEPPGPLTKRGFLEQGFASEGLRSIQWVIFLHRTLKDTFGSETVWCRGQNDGFVMTRKESERNRSWSI